MGSPPLPWAMLLASMTMVAAAGVVRGLAGFGFSALSVAGLALLVSRYASCLPSSCST